jgi:hypothetical protein
MVFPTIYRFQVYVEDGVFPFYLVEDRTKISKILLQLIMYLTPEF